MITGDFSSIHCVGALIVDDMRLLTEPEIGMSLISELLDSLSVAMLDSSSYSFRDQFGLQSGFTAFFLLAESHIALHTWPERNCMEVDVYLCNYIHNNRSKCKAIFNGIIEAFNAQVAHQSCINRPKIAMQLVHR